VKFCQLIALGADATAIEPKQAKKAKLEKSKSKKTSREEKLPVADEVSPNTQKPKSRPSRKTAADLFDNPADAVQQLSAKNTEAAPSTKGKKDKKKAVDSKKDDQTQQELSNPVVEASTVSSKITKMQGTTQAISSNDFEVFESEVDSEDDSEDDIPDASNLLAGFDTDSEDELPGLPLDQIPVPDIDGKALSKAREVQNDPPGILYIGYVDLIDRRLPSWLTPPGVSHAAFTSIKCVNTFLSLARLLDSGSPGIVALAHPSTLHSLNSTPLQLPKWCKRQWTNTSCLDIFCKSALCLPKLSTRTSLLALERDLR